MKRPRTPARAKAPQLTGAMRTNAGELTGNEGEIIGFFSGALAALMEEMQRRHRATVRLAGTIITPSAVFEFDTAEGSNETAVD